MLKTLKMDFISLKKNIFIEKKKCSARTHKFSLKSRLSEFCFRDSKIRMFLL